MGCVHGLGEAVRCSGLGGADHMGVHAEGDRGVGMAQASGHAFGAPGRARAVGAGGTEGSRWTIRGCRAVGG
jgi:hypothetical protein